MKIYDVIVVGAGPAGLTAAAALAEKGVNFLLIEKGKRVSQRGRYDQIAVTTGMGGAGLYSDGKFSFYPSASRLWQLDDQKQLQQSYEWVRELLEAYQVSCPGFMETKPHQNTGQNFKHYSSEYMPLSERQKFIDELVSLSSENQLVETEVKSIRMHQGLVQIETSNSNGTQHLFTRNLIIAGGRFAPLWLKESGFEFCSVFRRIEVGFRIRGSFQHPFFKTLKQNTQTIDPKLILKDGKSEWRTFCFCDRGEVVAGDFQGGVVLSGRSDCEPTQESNVGFNTRILDQTVPPSFPVVQNSFTFDFEKVMNNIQLLKDFYPESYLPFIENGMKRLAGQIPEVLDKSTAALQISGPTIEGIGIYPSIDHHLKMPGLPIYIVGDAGGIFRGTVAALVSGHYCAERLSQEIHEQELVTDTVEIEKYV